jgi:hypothetical protein
MGLPARELYVTNIGDEEGYILLSKYIPIKKEDGYDSPPNTPFGDDMWIPNVLNLTEDDGTVPVKVVKSDVETGLWVICFNDYFGNEIHMYTCKPFHKEEKDRFGDYKSFRDWEFPEDDINVWGLHIWFKDLNDLVAGDGPIPVTLVKTTDEEETVVEKKKGIFQKIKDLF